MATKRGRHTEGQSDFNGAHVGYVSTNSDKITDSAQKIADREAARLKDRAAEKK